MSECSVDYGNSGNFHLTFGNGAVDNLVVATVLGAGR